ncbi:MAG: TonB-dependent receptor [Steroidobacteraceae bacterium]
MRWKRSWSPAHALRAQILKRQPQWHAHHWHWVARAGELCRCRHPIAPVRALFRRYPRTQSTFSGVGTAGLNLANLRNLGSVRTLTLINGRRMPGGTSTSTSVDFNTIPTVNIERVEIQTGGASAIYGADAVAGVVNIITRKKFEGIEVGLSYGESRYSDNSNPSAHIMFGSAFGSGGHALVTLQYDKQGRVSCSDRFLCAEDFLWLSPTTQIRGPAAYSGVGVGGRFFAGNASYTTRNGSITDSSGALIPFSTPVDGYNRNAQRDLAIPTRRTMLAADVEYPLSAGVQIFAELNYGLAEIDSAFEAHPFQSNQGGSLFGGGPGIPGLQPSIPVDNPFVPAALRSAVLAANPAATDITWWQRFAFINDRGAENTRATMRGVAGLKGELESLAGFGSDWRWELSHVWGQTRVDLSTEGQVSTARLYHGLRVEPDPARPGQYRCADAGARATGCIPINPFAYTPEMISALRLGSNSEGTSELQDTVAWIGGTVVTLPAGPLQVVVGAEHRSFDGYLDYDNVINGALATGNQIGDIDPARVTSSEVFVETLIPLLRDVPFARALDVEAAYRYSDTKDIDRYGTWKAGLSWSPVESLRVRAMQARAVRTPLPGELSGIGQTFGVVRDPCTEGRRTLNATRATNCTADGVPSDYNPGQIIEQSVEGLTGGNPALGPEEGTTLTYGFVWTPSFAPGLSVSVDRFQIEVEDIITTVSRQTAVDLCYDQRLFCDVVTRGTSPLLPGASYVLRAVNEQLQNVASYDIRGIDVDLRPSPDLGRRSAWRPVGHDALRPRRSGTAAGRSDARPARHRGWQHDRPGLHRAGTRAKLLAASSTRHGRVGSSGARRPAFGTREAGFPGIGFKSYHALRLGYAFREGSEIFVGANNLFDEDPPFFCSGCSGTQALDTIPGYYDIFGVVVLRWRSAAFLTMRLLDAVCQARCSRPRTVRRQGPPPHCPRPATSIARACDALASGPRRRRREALHGIRICGRRAPRRLP